MSNKNIKPKVKNIKPKQQTGLPALKKSYIKYAEFIVILLLVFITYGNSVKNDYNVDDGYIVSIDEGNKLTKKGILAIPEILSSNYSSGPGVTYGYRPFGKVTMAIEYTLWGNNPQYSHFINLLLYALNIFLLLLFIKKVAGLFNYANNKIIYLSVLLFIVHPIHTEVVCSIKNREEILCFIFTLGALFMYFKISETGKWKYLIPFLIYTVLAFLSKQTAINIFSVLLVIILFREWILKAEYTLEWRQSLTSIYNRIKLIFPDKKKIMYGILFLLFTILAVNILSSFGIVLSLLILNKWMLKDDNSPATVRFKSITSVTNLSVLALVFLIYQLVMNYIPSVLPEGDIGKQFESNPYFFSPASHSFPNGVQTLLFYVKKLIIPYPLLFFYGYNMLPDQGWNSFYPYLGLILFIIISALVIRSIIRKQHLFFIFWLLFFSVTVFPFSNLLKDFYVTGIVGERLIYQTSAAFCILLVFGLDELSGILRKNIPQVNFVNRDQLLYGFSGLLFLVFITLTIDRNKDWLNKTTLYSNDISFLSNSARANYMMAGTFMRIVDSPGGRVPEKEQALNDAKLYYHKALNIYPGFDDAWLRLGTIYNLYLSMPDSALYCYNKIDSITSKIKYARAQELMGSIYQKKSDTIQALKFYRNAFRFYPEDLPVYQEMIILLLDTKQYDEIIPLANIAIKNKWPEAYANLGDAYLNKKDTTTAISYYEKALENGFKNDVLMKNLDYYYKLKERQNK